MSSGTPSRGTVEFFRGAGIFRFDRGCTTAKLNNLCRNSTLLHIHQALRTHTQGIVFHHAITAIQKGIIIRKSYTTVRIGGFLCRRCDMIATGRTNADALHEFCLLLFNTPRDHKMQCANISSSNARKAARAATVRCMMHCRYCNTVKFITSFVRHDVYRPLSKYQAMLIVWEWQCKPILFSPYLHRLYALTNIHMFCWMSFEDSSRTEVMCACY